MVQNNRNAIVLTLLPNKSLLLLGLPCHQFFSICLPYRCRIYYHHHHVAPSAQISLTLSHYPSLSSIASGRSSGLTSRIGTELLYVGSSWSSCLCLSVRSGPQEYITYELMSSVPQVWFV